MPYIYIYILRIEEGKKQYTYIDINRYKSIDIYTSLSVIVGIGIICVGSHGFVVWVTSSFSTAYY